MTLKIGYDLFAGASQAGTNSGVPGVLQLETAKALAYRIRLVRASDSYYWNETTGAFQAGATAEADELLIPGSDGLRPGAIRRLAMRLPKEAIDDITAAGFTVTAYAAGDTPSSAGVDMTLEFQP